MNNVEILQQQEAALNVNTVLVAVDLSPHSERTVAYRSPDSSERRSR